MQKYIDTTIVTPPPPTHSQPFLQNATERYINTVISLKLLISFSNFLAVAQMKTILKLKLIPQPLGDPPTPCLRNH